MKLPGFPAFLRPPDLSCFHRFRLAVLTVAAATLPLARASECTSFAGGIPLGSVDITALKEASGLAVSARNPGVVWTHNDGSSKKVYAINLQAQLLARYDTGITVEDVEDIAVGPGPITGTSYIYLSDTGGAASETTVRNQIRIVRIPEPAVSSTAPASPPSIDFTGAQSFLLTYPDGASFDCEALMVDPRNSDILLLTKEKPVCRIYRANLNAAANGAVIPLTLTGNLSFSEPSAADIAMDGSQILVRNENLAIIWNRTTGESVESALARPGTAVPVIGTPTEPNGEAISFLRDGSGYLTISEGENPPLYYFESTCPRAPSVVLPLTDQTVPAGGAVTFSAQISGNPPPAYAWKFNGQPLAGQTSSSLTLPSVTAASAGTYELTATNAQGSTATAAALTVSAAVNIRITEVMSQAASGNNNSADWWELSNLGTQAVSLAGWRFNDDTGGLGTAFTLPAGLTIAGGESIVFVEDLTAAQFRTWWGAAAIPASVKIITYTGNGLAFAANGDGLRVWNAAAASDTDTVDSVDFGATAAGVSFNYNPALNQFGTPSQLGVNGVFKAASAADIGSPGLYKVSAPLVVPNVTVSRNGDNLHIAFTTTAGQTYILQVSDAPGTEPWSPTGDQFTATSNAGSFFEKPITATRRFYRIQVQ